MSKRRDIRLHEITLDSLDEIKGRLDTLIDYHEQANNQRIAAEKEKPKSMPPQAIAGYWAEELRQKDAQLSKALTEADEYRKGQSYQSHRASVEREKVQELAEHLRSAKDRNRALADERATLAKRVSLLEAACDEWAEKCRKDYDNLGGQIRTLTQGMDNWQKEAGRNHDRAQAMETDRDLWQARCNNACQKLSELDTDNRYNGIQVDCESTRTQLDYILKQFLNCKKKAVRG